MTERRTHKVEVAGSNGADIVNLLLLLLLKQTKRMRRRVMAICGANYINNFETIRLSALLIQLGRRRISSKYAFDYT